MTRFCTFCRAEITEEIRIRRNSPYCSPECKRANDRERRELLREGRCEWCGRRKYQEDE